MTIHRIALAGLALASLAVRVPAQEVTRLYGSSASDLWMLTDRPSIVHFDGRQWTDTPVQASGTLRDLWASGPRDAWAVGEQGTLLHWDGTSWRPMTAPVRKDLVRVTGCSAAAVYVVAQSESDQDPAILLRWDGHAWTQVAISPPFRVSDLVCVSGAGGGEIAAAGTVYFDPVPSERRSTGIIARNHAGAWTTTGYDGHRSTEPALVGVGIMRYCADAAGGSAIVRRDDGSRALLRHAGARWTEIPAPTLPPGSDITDADWLLARDCTPLVVFNQGYAVWRASEWHVVAPGVAAQEGMQSQTDQAQRMVQSLNLQPGQAPTPEQMRQMMAIAQAQAQMQPQMQQSQEALLASQVWNFGMQAMTWAPSGADFYVSTQAGRVVHVTGDTAVTVYDLICTLPQAASLPQCQALQQAAPAHTPIPQPSHPAPKPRP